MSGADRDASTELGRLMHVFFCTDPDDMNYSELADKVRYFKEDERGVARMCKVMEDMRRETAARTKEQITANHLLDIMEKLRYTAEQAMDLLSIPQAERATYAGLERRRT